MQRTNRAAAALLLLVALAAPVAAGGAQDAAISGTVTDTTGLVLPGVTVEARDAAGDPAGTAVSDGAGRFTISALLPGAYAVTFTLPGFQRVVRSGVEIGAGATVTLDVELAVELEERVVVLGSRAQPRSVTESQVPIDAIPFQDIASQGLTTLDYQLRTLVPSFNVATHPISDAATLVRPASIRNLAHDHTLVLVNGKRRHRSSVIAWFAGVTDGAQGPDISTIPSIALRQVEVLRDGASAQYGSDAIAGVLNFLLKDNARRGAASSSTPAPTAPATATPTAWPATSACRSAPTASPTSAWSTATPDPTNRSVQRADAAALIAAGNTDVADPAQIWGNPTIEDDLKLFGNFGSLLGNGCSSTATPTTPSKKVTEGFYFRNPNNRANIYSLDDGETLLIGDRLGRRRWHTDARPTARRCGSPTTCRTRRPSRRWPPIPHCFSFREIAPGGFTPRVRRRGDRQCRWSRGCGGSRDSGLTWDASASYGSHESDFFFQNTVNASLGLDTPRDFDPGPLQAGGGQPQLRRLVRRLRHGERRGRHRVARREVHDRRGRAAVVGGRVRTPRRVSSPAPTASPAFPTTRPGTWNRSNVAVYGDLELRDRDDRWSFGGALRLEHFDLFGATTNGKLSARYALSPHRRDLRGGVSTGFRAPTPGQQHTLNVQTTIDPETLQLVDSANVPSTFLAATLRGGVPLEPETSVNTTAGVVVDNGPFTLTADYFRVDVSDRLALSQTFTLDGGRFVRSCSRKGSRRPAPWPSSGSSSTTSRPGRRASTSCRPTPRRISGATRCSTSPSTTPTRR